MNYFDSCSSSFFLLTLQTLLSLEAVRPQRSTGVTMHQSSATGIDCEIQMFCGFLAGQCSTDTMLEGI